MDKVIVRYPICRNCGKENDCAAGIYCFDCAMTRITSGHYLIKTTNKLPKKRV